jgi:hypothetical protein
LTHQWKEGVEKIHAPLMRLLRKLKDRDGWLCLMWRLFSTITITITISRSREILIRWRALN